MNSWLYSDNPVMFLSFSEEIAELREDMKKGWFEKLIRKYFFDNKHAANVILLPSPGLEERKSEIVKEKLEKIKNEFTEEEKNQLKIKNEKLQNIRQKIFLLLLKRLFILHKTEDLVQCLLMYQKMY